MTAPHPHRQMFLVTSIRLAAVGTAVSSARMFIRQSLRDWDLADHADDAELIASELVGNAVKATGSLDEPPKSTEITAQHVIGVQLRVVDTSLYVEVWDNGTVAPVRQKQSLEAEGGRGLFLVEMLSVKWDIYRSPVGGKVVWSQLALARPVDPSIHHVPLPHRVPGETDPPDSPARDMAEVALLQRVLDGLSRL